MRTIVLGFMSLMLAFSVGCARYKSQAPVQEQNMLPTRYQDNTDQNNSLYTRNANFVSHKTPTSGVRVSKTVARTILKSHPELQAATVVIIKNSAYVAVTMNPKQKTLGNLRYQIPALVKDMEPTVDKVYLSNNPNFRRMLERYQ